MPSPPLRQPAAALRYTPIQSVTPQKGTPGGIGLTSQPSNWPPMTRARVQRRHGMNATTRTEDTGLFYEFGDLLLAVIAVAIPLVALPLYLL